jgi:hypothetical protein
MIPPTVLPTTLPVEVWLKVIPGNAECEELFNTINLLLNIGLFARRTRVD